MISAHEASDKQPQKGFMFSWADEGTWWEMDLSDPANTCVNVHADGGAWIGGLISDAGGYDVGRGPLGRYFGINLEDGGEPAFWIDRSQTVRMNFLRQGQPGWEVVRDAFLDWCATGDDPGFTQEEGYVVWFGIIFMGNFKVHNSPKDGD